tara:strand:- start:1023 stop:1541 length:519 start_codon:yes stop_codon:yes gene_type:complete
MRNPETLKDFLEDHVTVVGPVKAFVEGKPLESSFRGVTIVKDWNDADVYIVNDTGISCEIAENTETMVLVSSNPDAGEAMNQAHKHKEVIKNKAICVYTSLPDNYLESVYPEPVVDDVPVLDDEIDQEPWVDESQTTLPPDSPGMPFSIEGSEPKDDQDDNEEPETPSTRTW